MASEGYLNTVYHRPDGETTQWEDIQTRLGNFAPRAPAWKADKWESEKEETKDKKWIDGKHQQELEEMDNDETKDDRFLEEYRQKRIAALQKAAMRPRFGTVEEIRGSEFVSQVSQAGPEIWVICHLYKEGNSGCGIINKALEQLAKRYPSTKVLKSVSTDCIPNYPDKNLPTLLLYHEGICKQHIIGLAALGGPNVTAELLAIQLSKYGDFCPASGDDDEGVAAGQREQVRELVQKLIEQKELINGEDESSDFDD
jgi:hypothetical protein